MKRLCFLLTVFIMVSCSPGNREDGYVYFRLDSNPTTMDPAHVVDVTGGSLCAKLFNGLVKIDDSLRIMPDLAERWEISRHGTRYTFFLKKGVTFSSGREVKAQDFVYSFTRVLSPETRSPVSWVLDRIRGARAFRERKRPSVSGLQVEGDYVLHIDIEEPFSPFLSLLSMTAASVVPEEAVLRHGDEFGFRPVGTGPYVLAAWRPNNELVMTARRDYFEGAPKVRGLVFRVIPEDLTAITEFELGNIDVLVLPISAYRYYAEQKAWRERMTAQEGLNTYYLGFNCGKDPFSNGLVRKAAAFAIDVEKIFRTFYEGRGRPAIGPVPDTLREWDVVVPYHYDLEKARALLREADVPLPVNVDFFVTADQNVVDIAEIVQFYLNRAGFAVRIRQLEWSAYKEAINRGEPDMFYLSWWADYPDPENFLYPLFHSSNIGPAGNRTRYANADVDRLIGIGQAATERDVRNRAYGRAEQLVVNDAPWLPLWHRNDYLVRQRWIRDYEKPPIYTSDKAVTVRIASQPAGPQN